MFIRKPFNDTNKKKRAKDAVPAWHTPVREIFTFTKQINTRCGKTYIILDSEIKKRIPNGERPCEVCSNLANGRDSTLRIWSSTGLSPRK